ncbi:hypothetical protein ALO95_200312 [Pseudomonas syringae pv. antirrhini]|uniref:Plasmid replication protein RepB n=1 Tax=Pseudomonas amygdali pv. ulmi TaxID=251720 RepID=A0A0Q0JQA1_PSEA0|nr:MULTISPECIES: hypothetical protein [Pseudomonas syringae group]KPZ16410.1 hypothetical protein ALO41_200073 [Pseudomonas amygdali pv. ulmi]KWS27236.1 hypothetical protein AL065_19105 [Pseudomonas amygdali pv. ulmi]RMP44326.1 hypothetical protein ALQ23_200358 [Pseudomonas syringae pv. antirrhini]RMW26019.1 hypothetical protein ALO95_200312 [Pseudomonas syringae pv. antirrhini]
MNDGINTVLEFSLIGSRDKARFRISPIGNLRIEFATPHNYLEASAKLLRVDQREISLDKMPVTEISYGGPNAGASWQVVISRADGDALQEALRNNAQSFQDVFGSPLNGKS